MNNLFVILVLSSCFLIGQELPGWGVYTGGAICGVSSDNYDNVEMQFSLPNIGVTRGVMLSGLPLILGFGLHKRGYKLKTEFNEKLMDVSFIDGFGLVPFPVGPTIIQGGLYVGTHAFGNEKEKEFYQGEWAEEVEKETSSNKFNIDFGVLFGISYPIGPTAIFLAYQLGLAEHFDERERYSGIHFNFGYNF